MLFTERAAGLPYFIQRLVFSALTELVSESPDARGLQSCCGEVSTLYEAVKPYMIS